MTELYQKHAENNIKREKLMQMPDFMGLNTSNIKELPEANDTALRTELAQQIESLPDDRLNEALSYIKKLK
jgi:hypothetical protein